MKNRLLFLLIFVVVGCGNKLSKNENKFDTNYFKMIPIVAGNQSFAFSDLSENVWDWQNSPMLIKIDSALWFNYINKPKALGDYEYNYQSNYFYKLIDFNDKFINVIVLQHIKNNNESYMYLLQFDKEGIRRKTLLIASIYKSPDEFEEVHSSIIGNKIITYKNYVDEANNKRDTVINTW